MRLKVSGKFPDAVIDFGRLLYFVAISCFFHFLDMVFPMRHMIFSVPLLTVVRKQLLFDEEGIAVLQKSCKNTQKIHKKPIIFREYDV